MKSLEHIIRDIREGKGIKGDKKSLEHSIRKVVKGERESSFADRTTKPIDDDVGGLIGSGTGGEPKLHKESIGIIGTDDYKGNQFKSVRTQTPHIKPPTGAGSHSQAPENVSRQRTFAKERQSMTMQGKVTEGVKEKLAGTIIKGLKDLLRVAPEANLPAVITPKGAPVKPKLKFPSEVEPKVEVPSKVDTKIEPKVEVPSKVDVSGKTEIKTDTKVPSKISTETLPVPKVPEMSKTDTKNKPAELPATETKTATQVPKTVPNISPLKGFNIPSLGGASVPHAIDYTASHLFRPKINVGHAKAHKKHAMKESLERKEIENMPRKGDRKTIEYVGRKDADPKSVRQKTSRLATIKNVIDEAKKQISKKTSYEDGKTKVFDYGKDVLVINPDQKRIDLDVDGNKLPKDYDNK